jgi:hypothetical protein
MPATQDGLHYKFTLSMHAKELYVQHAVIFLAKAAYKYVCGEEGSTYSMRGMSLI